MKFGDFLDYSGIKVGEEIICYSITVNIGIFTKAGTAPGFIRVDDAIIGIIDNTPDTEFARAIVSEDFCWCSASPFCVFGLAHCLKMI